MHVLIRQDMDATYHAYLPPYLVVFTGCVPGAAILHYNSEAVGSSELLEEQSPRDHRSGHIPVGELNFVVSSSAVRY